MEKSSLLTSRIFKKYFRGFYTNHCLFWKYNRAELDIEYLCNEKNIDSISHNINRRKSVGNIINVKALKHKLESIHPSDSSYKSLKKNIHRELLKIPNKTHPQVFSYGDERKLVKYINSKKSFDFKPKTFCEISRKINLVRTDQLGNVCGSKNYYLLGELAELEQALINYFLERLLQKQFHLISVPDILPRYIVESCGMNTRGVRDQVYTMSSQNYVPDLCLSGTSEIALAGFHVNKLFSEEKLPLKLVAVSRCYRAETSNISEERGIFRVHEFTKVEMFILCDPLNSDAELENLRILQEDNFESLGLHFQVIDMPPHELGAQAYRKYDIEAWMPGRGLYGEISSCSNCTDFQSRRLNIKYKSKYGQYKFIHTLNGTACAVPRLLISLIETCQDRYGTIQIPIVLQKYMRGRNEIGRQKDIPELKLIKNKNW